MLSKSPELWQVPKPCARYDAGALYLGNLGSVSVWLELLAGMMVVFIVPVSEVCSTAALTDSAGEGLSSAQLWCHSPGLAQTLGVEQGPATRIFAANRAQHLPPYGRFP